MSTVHRNRITSISAAVLLGSLLAASPGFAQSAATSAASDQPANEMVPPTSANDFTASQINAVLEGHWRSAAHRARDASRHPKATLQFFGIRPDETVIEITPGGGWYSEILAPLLKDNGHYIAAVMKPSTGDEAKQNDSVLHRKFAADPARFGDARIIAFDAHDPVLGPPDSADAVLTFRNVHNWVAAGTAPAMFKAFFAVLKPGGTLGVVDHRAAPGADLDKVVNSGYLPVASVVKFATDAGFTLQKHSDINANPRDSRDHPKGVWTLPPTLALGDKSKAKYEAIGESDRMTLRFVKPGKADSPDNGDNGAL